MSELREGADTGTSDTGTGDTGSTDTKGGSGDIRSMIAGLVEEGKRDQGGEGTAGEDQGERRERRDRRPVGGAIGGEDRGDPSKTAEPGDKPATGAGDGREPAKPGEQPGKEASAATGAPQHWSKEDRDIFDKLPEAARGPFLNIYKRMEAGFAPKLQRGAQLERDFADVERLLAPHQEEMRQKGMSHAQLIGVWHQVESGLGSAAQKDAIAARIIHNYGCDPVAVARHLNQLRGFPAVAGDDRPNGTGANGATNGAGNGAAGVDPVLNQRLQALEQSHFERIRADVIEKTNAAQAQINAFAAEKDAAGDLLHPFFSELEADMFGLAQLDRAAGKTPEIADLYSRAVWANPSTRERLQTSQRDAETKRAAEERKAKADQARRAGSSVTGAPGPGQARVNQPDRSIRDEIRAGLDAQRRA